MLRAMQAGAAHVSVALSQQDNQVSNDIDGGMFFEARVTATASGPPLTRSDRDAPHAQRPSLAQQA